MISQLFQTEYIDAIAWTLIHSLWQVTLIACVLAAVLYFKRGATSTFRYRISVFSMMVSVVIAYITFWFRFSGGAESIISTGLNSGIEVISIGMIEAQRSWIQAISVYLSEHASIVANFWLLGIVVFSIRLLGGIIYVQRLVRGEKQIADPKLKYAFVKIKDTIGVKQDVLLSESCRVAVPMVIGFIKPVVLFPIGVMNRLSIPEVEAILAHELAHVKRNDYLVNLIQSAAEVIFYYHPAMWWISSMVTSERENCCDDVAINQCGSSLTYAHVLVKLQEQEMMRAPQLAMAFSRNNKGLKTRIMRILNQPIRKSKFREKLIAAVLLFTAVLAFSSHGNVVIDAVDNIKDRITAHADHENRSIELNYSIAALDTLPKLKERRKESITISKSTDDEDVYIEMEDGEIKKLKIDGEEIDSSDYDKHDILVEELIPDAHGHGNFFYHFSDDDHPMMFFADSMNMAFEHLDSIGNCFKSLQHLDKDFELNFDFEMPEMGRIEVYPYGELKDFDWEEFNEEHGERMEEHNFSLEEMEELQERLHETLEHVRPGVRAYHFDREDHPFADEDNGYFFEGGKFSNNISRELNRDGLLEIGKENKVELTGKHLKINGDKQPENIYKKYKGLYERSTGIDLTKNSKVELLITGKKNKRLFDSY